MEELPPPVSADERVSASAAVAPDGFLFPESFKTLIASPVLPEIDPAFFLIESDADSLVDWTRILAKQFPDRLLVPFAKDDGSDDIYCFDGNDISGNPTVVLIHSFTKPGWEYRGEWIDFDSWLAAARELNVQWKRAL